MSNLKKLFEALHIDLALSSLGEIKWACDLIIDVQEMSGAERSCICMTFNRGPVDDGEIPSKAGRDNLLEKGYIAKIVVKGEDGFNACTHKGAWAFRLIDAGI